MKDYSVKVEFDGFLEQHRADNALDAIRKFCDKNGKYFFDDMVYLLVSRIETGVVIRFVVNTVKGKITKIDMEGIVS
jgi:hypothetical protein